MKRGPWFDPPWLIARFRMIIEYFSKPYLKNFGPDSKTFVFFEKNCNFSENFSFFHWKFIKTIFFDFSKFAVIFRTEQASGPGRVLEIGRKARPKYDKNLFNRILKLFWIKSKSFKKLYSKSIPKFGKWRIFIKILSIQVQLEIEPTNINIFLSFGILSSLWIEYFLL